MARVSYELDDLVDVDCAELHAAKTSITLMHAAIREPRITYILPAALRRGGPEVLINPVNGHCWQLGVTGTLMATPTHRPMKQV
jgi:hypothetical protein